MSTNDPFSRSKIPAAVDPSGTDDVAVEVLNGTIRTGDTVAYSVRDGNLAATRIGRVVGITVRKTVFAPVPIVKIHVTQSSDGNTGQTVAIEKLSRIVKLAGGEPSVPDGSRLVAWFALNGWTYIGFTETGIPLFTGPPGTAELRATDMQFTPVGVCVHCGKRIQRSTRLWVTFPRDGYTSFCDANKDGGERHEPLRNEE